MKVSFLRVFLFVIPCLLSIVITACTDDCPTKADDNVVEFDISIAQYYVNNNPWTWIQASFFGDPVPNVEFFHLDDSALTIMEHKINPFCSDRFLSSKKTFKVDSEVNNITINETIVIPDSFIFIEPLNQSVVPADTELVIRWTESSNFDDYFVIIIVYQWNKINLIDTLYETRYYSDSNSTIIPAKYMKSDHYASFYVSAIKGSNRERGQANFIRDNVRGYLSSEYRLNTTSVIIE